MKREKLEEKHKVGWHKDIQYPAECFNCLVELVSKLEERVINLEGGKE